MAKRRQHIIKTRGRLGLHLRVACPVYVHVLPRSRVVVGDWGARSRWTADCLSAQDQLAGCTALMRGPIRRRGVSAWYEQPRYRALRIPGLRSHLLPTPPTSHLNPLHIPSTPSNSTCLLKSCPATPTSSRTHRPARYSISPWQTSSLWQARHGTTATTRRYVLGI